MFACRIIFKLFYGHQSLTDITCSRKPIISFFRANILFYENRCAVGEKSLLILTSDIIVFNNRLNRFREFNNCYAYRRLMCIQNIIVITQIFEIFCCSCLFILVNQLSVARNAFSDGWLISTRIH